MNLEHFDTNLKGAADSGKKFNLNIPFRSGRHILMLEFMNMESFSGDRSLKIISFTKGTEYFLFVIWDQMI